MPALVLYVRQECHLCEAFLLDLSLDFPAAFVTLETRDVDAEPTHAADYGLRVPVLCRDAAVVCEGRYDRARVAAALGL